MFDFWPKFRMVVMVVIPTSFIDSSNGLRMYSRSSVSRLTLDRVEKLVFCRFGQDNCDAGRCLSFSLKHLTTALRASNVSHYTKGMFPCVVVGIGHVVRLRT